MLDPGCGGSPYAGIQDAIDAALPGDVVEVCPGTYAERLSIREDLTLTSTGGASVTTVEPSWGAGLDVTSGAVVVVSGFTFRGGSTSGVGGNVRCEDAALELRDSVLLGGSASQGGGVGMVRCSGVVEGNTFRDNEASDTGGGLYAGADVAVLDNLFEDNRSDGDGGAAYLRESSADIAGNVMVGNTSDTDGGGLYVEFGSPRVDGNTFEDNDAGDDGGALRVKLATATITGNLFTWNHADYRGGAIRVSHEAVVMGGNTYVENSAADKGGAVLLFESASEVRDETYVGNTAETGGALAIIEGWGGVELEDCTFQANSADEGGQLYVELRGQTTTLRRVDFVDGRADRGGGVYAVGSDIAFDNVLFESNAADDAGGALYLDGVTGHLTNAVAIWNRSPDGSAVLVDDGSAGLEVVNSVFVENADGAAVELSDGTAPTLRYDAFDGNDDDFSGMSDAIGDDGNLGVPPAFQDPTAGDYALSAGSPLRDAGDPGISDVDGSRCDIGLLGGPGA